MIEVDVCDSTQDLAWKILSEDPARDFVAVRASRQTAGRGRRQRAWSSEEGNLLLTLGLRVRRESRLHWPFVSLLAGHAAARALKDASSWDAACFVKWPNDLCRAEDTKIEKFGGILAELRQELLLVGVGINIGVRPEIDEHRYSAGALAAFVSKPPTPADLAHAIQDDFRANFARWSADSVAVTREIVDDLNAVWMKPFFGRRSTVEALGDVQALRLLEDGRLQVRQCAAPCGTHELSSEEILLKH
jgi:biotin-[acetyl-CoA-carboxylase] ligase BirA-like protein